MPYAPGPSDGSVHGSTKKSMGALLWPSSSIRLKLNFPSASVSAATLVVPI